MNAASLSDYQWLVGDHGNAWYGRIQLDTRPLVQLTQALRKDLSATRVHLLLQLRELRERAKVKFERAESLYFTPRGLEQATDQWIARYKAERFAADGPSADLCCGIGGDLFALGARTEATGVDCDSVHALLALTNARVLDLPGTDIVESDVADFDIGRFSAWHIDPDRRPAGRRTSQLDFSTPPLPILERLLAITPNGAIKSAPAAILPEHWSESAERQWIGSGRECKQQVAWFGNLAWHPGRRSVVVVHHRGECSNLLIGQEDELVEIADDIGSFVYEPHAAVLAARLSNTLANQLGLKSLAPTVAIYTGARPVTDPLLSCFEVIDVLPFDLRKLRSALRHHDIGTLEVKKRGVTLDPIQVRKQLETKKGSQHATMLVAPHAGKVRAVLAHRVFDETETH